MKQDRQRHWWKPLLVVAALLGVVFGYVQWRLARLESAVWHRGAPHELAASRPFLEGLANGRLLASWQSRAQGLLGDLAYHRGEFERAFDYYQECAKALVDAIHSTEFMLVAAPLLVGASAEFSEGFRDYQSSATPPPPVDETGLNWQHPGDALSESRWQAFLSIPDFHSSESSRFRRALQTANRAGLDMTLIAEICAAHASQIAELRQLAWPLIPADPDSFDDLPKMTHSARLLMLNAVRCAHAGDNEGAIQSFDAAYMMLGSFEKNPRVATLIAVVSTRLTFLEVLETGEGALIRELIRPEHRLDISAWQNMAAGEYQSFKRLLETSFQGRGHQAERICALALAKQNDYWSDVTAHGRSTRGSPSMEAAISGWFYKHRRFSQLGHQGSRADGRLAAADLEDAMAEILHLLMIVNLGNLHDEMMDVIDRESAMLR